LIGIDERKKERFTLRCKEQKVEGGRETREGRRQGRKPRPERDPSVEG